MDWESYSGVTTWKTLWEASEGCQCQAPGVKPQFFSSDTMSEITPYHSILHGERGKHTVDEAAPRFPCPSRKTYSELCKLRTVKLFLSFVTIEWRHISGINGSSRLAQGKTLSKSSHSCALKIHMPECLVYQGSKKLCPSQYLAFTYLMQILALIPFYHQLNISDLSCICLN